MCHGLILDAKVVGTDEIVGGYNRLAWDNSTRGDITVLFFIKNELSRMHEVKAIVKSLKNCEEKIGEAFSLFDEAKDLLSNQNLEFSGNYFDDARIVARENVNNCKVKGINFVSL
ncbi:hypothetical protein Glove_213g135 [Diversispora epigaea]|uniref:Uncharacterized protein n=1 Tax=Diversispora epigaea TaxID=1348612 RepID=A0A397IMS5_9GLOM|nr:hypothetical protein Glove_213g135 [Diversispora epigaea]